MQTVSVVLLIILLLVIWLVYTQRRLAELNKSTDAAMKTISVQLGAQLQALSALVELIRDKAPEEYQLLSGVLSAQRTAVTLNAAASEVTKREWVIRQTFERISLIAANCDELSGSAEYKSAAAAIESSSYVLHTGCLIYNVSVTKLNRALRHFPANALAGSWGFHHREYLELLAAG